MNNPAQKRGLFLVAIILLISLVVLAFQWKSESPEQQAGLLFDEAQTLFNNGRFTEAEQSIREAIELIEVYPEARLLAARIAISQQQYEKAILDLELINDESNSVWYSAQLLLADLLHNHVYRFREAEQIYQRMLAVNPDDLDVNDHYARLLGLCGRRTEAIPHILKLIRAGRETDLLMLVSLDSGALSDPQKLQTARQADPTDPNPILGLAYAASSDQEYDRALELLRFAKNLEGLPTDYYGRIGQNLLSAGRIDELQEWSRNLPESPQSFDSWVVLGKLSEQSGDMRAAIRCYWEALKLRPESLSATNGLAQALIADNQTETAQPFLTRIELLNHLRDSQHATIRSSETPSETQVVELIQSFLKAGRIWNAYAWGDIALVAHPNNPHLQLILKEIRPQISELPLVLTKPELNPALQVDFSQYPLPNLILTKDNHGSYTRSSEIAFVEQAAELGFEFEYNNGTPTHTYRMFEFAGGGIAALDYDQDGTPDLLCTQGRDWDQLQTDQTESHDRLFRNQNGIKFQDVSDLAGFSGETGFGQGISAGDINNDGFVDVYIANTDFNSLWINNGDGTFSDRTSSIKGMAPQWTTSCLIADINGDSFPDIYDVNYLAGDDLFDRVCTDENGVPDLCKPKDFAGAIDRLWLGDGAGGFNDQTAQVLKDVPNGKGLGIAAFNSGEGRLSLFVANDTVANHFYQYDSPDTKTMSDISLISGLAFSGEGKAEACMGIAAADCDQDGRTDLFVTNFLHESNTLYSEMEESIFKDRTQEFGLQVPTLTVLGFGTQFLDTNLDGRLELFVANGYTHDLSRSGIPYAMPAHFFEWTGHQFEQWPADKVDSWGLNNMVGRAVARLDWNSDGLPDLVVGRLDGPSLLLTNKTTDHGNSYLSLELISTETARDAIGAIVKVSIGNSEWVHQLTAGDGYQCSNERKLMIGCAENNTMDRLEVTWSNGLIQEFLNVPTSQSLILVEGQKLLTTDSKMRMQIE